MTPVAGAPTLAGALSAAHSPELRDVTKERTMTPAGRTRTSLMRAMAACFAVGMFAASPVTAFGAGPVNDDFADAQDLGGAPTATTSGGNLWATAEGGEPEHNGNPPMASVWYRWTAPEDAVVSVDTCRSNFDTVLAVYRGPALAELDAVASNDDGCRQSSRLRFLAGIGTTYSIAVTGYRQTQGAIELNVRVTRPPGNDAFTAAFDLGRDLTALASGSVLDATPEYREPNHVAQRAYSSIWYRWSAPAGRNMQLDACGSDFDTLVAIYTGAVIDELRGVASDDDSCGRQSRVRFDAIRGTTYQIAVDRYPDRRRVRLLGLVRLALEPTNAFRFAGQRRDARRGTTTLVLQVPNPGVLSLIGTREIRRERVRARAAGRVAIRVEPRIATLSRLRAHGAAVVRAAVRYTPRGGRSHTERTHVRLVLG
jgi:hypothetical protein